jgi:hypothetical protein
MPLDATTSRAVTIDGAHSELHDGNAFSLYYAVASLAAADIGFRWVTPNSAVRVHMSVNAVSMDDAIVTFYEGGTPAGGAGATPINRNRGSAAVSACTGFNFGAITTGGGPTTLFQVRWGKKLEVGSGIRADGEWLLAQNTGYHLIMSGVTASEAFLRLEWYEV